MKQLFFFLLLSLPLLLPSCKEKANNNDADGMATDTVDNNMAGDVNGTYVIDPASSQVKWKGYKPTGEHNGIVPISAGTVTVADGNVTSGNIEMDMNGITVLDLEGENKMKLESHLKGKDPGKE